MREFGSVGEADPGPVAVVDPSAGAFGRDTMSCLRETMSAHGTCQPETQSQS
jgi:hypothetical protein